MLFTKAIDLLQLNLLGAVWFLTIAFQISWFFGFCLLLNRFLSENTIQFQKADTVSELNKEMQSFANPFDMNPDRDSTRQTF